MSKSISIAAIGLLAGASVASASNTVVFTSGDFSGTSGGEFIGTYTGDIIGKKVSFCLELNRTVNPNGSTVYDYTVADGDVGAIGGGSGGIVGGSDPLNAATGYIMMQWMQGKRTGGASGIENTVANSRAVQNAMWYLEQEIELGDLSQAHQDEVTDLLATVPNAYSIVPGANDFSALLGGSAVRVVNITRNGTDRQSQIILIPLPTASGMALAGLALVGTRRRR